MRIRFYLTASKRSPVEEFLAASSEDLRADFFDAIAMLSAGEVLAMPLSRNLSTIHAGLHELRLKDRSGAQTTQGGVTMAWKEVSTTTLAKELGVNANEVREKQRLVRLIVEARKRQKMSQAVLAKKLAVTQGRIAQIESGVGTNRVTFDVLLNILTVLGYDFRIVSSKAA